MNKLRFKPEDFKPILDLFDRHTYEHPENKAAQIAQAIFDEWLKSATVVYGNGRQMDVVSEPTDADTHKALLVCVEELKQKCEKHEPILKTFDFACWQHGVCRNCGESIEPTGWKAKE